MADEFDQAAEATDFYDELAMAANREQVAAMPKGNPGDCDLCGEWCGRLVGGACGFCRDKYKESK